MEHTEIIIADATCQWLNNHRIAMITSATNPNHETREKFYDFLLHLNKNWAADQPILVIYNTVNASINISSYDRQRMQELTDWFNDQQRTARSAVLVKKGFMSNVLYRTLEAIINRERKRQGDRVLTRFFYDVENAVAWLSEAIQYT